MANTHVSTEMTFLLCVRCFCSYGLPQQMLDARRKDGKFFYCPRGHRQSYDPPADAGDPAEVEKRRQLVKDIHDREQAEARAADAADKQDRATPLSDGPKPPTCEHCGKSYSSKAWLARHLRREHAESSKA